MVSQISKGAVKPPKMAGGGAWALRTGIHSGARAPGPSALWRQREAALAAEPQPPDFCRNAWTFHAKNRAPIFLFWRYRRGGDWKDPSNIHPKVWLPFGEGQEHRLGWLV